MTATISGDGTSTLISLTTSGNTILGDASTDTLNVGNGGLVKDASGNVGIGTASPATKLHLLTASATATALRAGNSVSYAEFQVDASGNSQLIAPGGTQIFNTNGAERMRIDSSGNVLFGKTSTDVTNAGIYFEPTTYGRFNFVKSSASGAGATPACRFYYNGSVVGEITNTSTATAFTTSSDYRLKENILPMTGALAKVLQLNPVTYNWKSDGSSSEGFIAHELQAVVSQCVIGEKDAVDAEGKPVYQGIDTSFLVATLTAAIQELKTLVDTQVNTITTLTDRITALEAK
jgi:hypothetical protein